MTVMSGRHRMKMDRINIAIKAGHEFVERLRFPQQNELVDVDKRESLALNTIVPQEMQIHLLLLTLQPKMVKCHKRARTAHVWKDRLIQLIRLVIITI